MCVCVCGCACARAHALTDRILYLGFSSLGGVAGGTTKRSRAWRGVHAGVIRGIADREGLN